MGVETIIPALATIVSASETVSALLPEQAVATVLDLLKRRVEAVQDGIGPNVAQGRAERSAEQEKQFVVEELQKLELNRHLQDQLLPLLKATGCRLESDGLEHPYGGCHYKFSTLHYDGAQAALLQVPPLVFKKDKQKKEIYIHEFAYMLTAFRGNRIRVRMLSENIGSLAGECRLAFEDVPNGTDWRFVGWEDVESWRQNLLAFWPMFSLRKPSGVVGKAGSPPKKVPPEALGRVEDVLTRYAQSLANVTPVSQTFGNWVTRSGWPDEWVRERSTGWKDTAPAGAHDFVEYMVAKGTFPVGHSLAGSSVLGEFLRKILEGVKVGGEDGEMLAGIIVEYRLVPDADMFKKYLRT
jgi:hypothetical protein